MKLPSPPRHHIYRRTAAPLGGRVLVSGRAAPVKNPMYCMYPNQVSLRPNNRRWRLQGELAPSGGRTDMLQRSRQVLRRLAQLLQALIEVEPVYRLR